MIKKTIILSILLANFSLFFCNAFFEPDFSLTGHMPIRNNKPDFYKNPKGISLAEDHIYFLDSMNAKIEYLIDHENEMILIYIKNGKYELTYPVYMSFEQYLDNIFAAVFEKEFNKIKLKNLTSKDRVDSKGLIPEIVIKLPPMAMPRTVRRIMGSQAGRLSLTGSQKITISSGRTHRKTKQLSEYGSNASFDITMRQDLNLNLKGTIGEKITVNIKYNSSQESSIFDPNNINIKYTGDEDEIVQSIEAGNTSLSISGSRYISVSASSQGLFGVKSVLKIGDLSITAIASKEEAQKNTRSFKGSAQADSTIIKSKDFSKRKRFFVVNPNDVFAFYDDNDSVPEGWVDNAIKTDPLGAWIVENPLILPKDGTVQVFIDDDIASNNITTVEGNLIRDDGTVDNTIYHFDVLIEGTDYHVNYDTGILTIFRQVDRRHTVAVSYIERSNVTIGNTLSSVLQLKPLKTKNQDKFSETWKYELRNIYDLNMTNIRNEGFLLEVFTELSNRERNYLVPDSIPGGSGLTFNEYLRLDTNNDGRIDGDDATVNLSSGLIILPFINPFWGLNDITMYQEEFVNEDQYQHFFFLRGRIGRDQVNLGMMILPGSVTVRVNGRELKENIDYLVDYDFGSVTFLTPEGKDPDSDIQINYENRPLFAIESKSLFGVRADWRVADYLRLGGTFIYHSEKISDKRPKIGNESRSLMLANVDGEFSVEPPFLTSAVDLIPLIKTDESSKISLSGEIAMNAPKIQGSSSFGDGKEAWLDDMESILDSYPLGIMRTTWVPASEPYLTNFVKGRVNWFNPNNVYYKDVYDPSTLSEKEKFEKVSVLDVKVIPPKIHSPGISAPVWGGLQKYIGNQVDFSEKEYIEFLVKVDSVDTRFSQVKMYIDMGDVSEDFYTENGGKGVLNTEDGANGGDVNGRLDYMEDVGLDGIPHGQPGYDPFDYFSNEEINGEFPFINGTEGNGRLDTEDLNGNGSLDTVERFFRYQVTLGDEETSFFQNENNGWYLYRLPLKKNTQMQTLANVNSVADLKKISYVRVWFETESLAKIRLVYVDVVGNKWKKMAVKERELLTETNVNPSVLSANNEFISIETIDNQKSRKYVAPPGTTEKGKDGEISFEQSLLINYNNIQPGHISLARQRFREQYNLLSYNKIRYWIYTESNSDAMFNADSLNAIFRLGSDSLNYYEILKPIKVNDFHDKMLVTNWKQIEIDYKDITFLKTLNDTADTLYVNDGVTYRIIRKPTLSNIREIAIGIQVPDNQNPFNGTIYFNDIRVAEPNQNVGYAARATLDTKFADFSTVRIDYEWKTADFYTSTSRNMTAATNLEDKVVLNITNNYSLHKFFPLSWGLRFPLNLSKNQSVGIPKYKTNSDIIRDNLSEEEKDREKNKSNTKQAETTLSMTRTPQSKLLAYTLKNVSLGANIREVQTLSATRADTVVTWRYTGSYNLSIPPESIRLKLFNNYYWFFAPKTFNNSANLRGEFPKRWDWNTTEETWKPRAQTIDTKILETSNEIRYDIFTDMNAGWKLNTKRDLMTEQIFKSVNIGEETERIQDIQYGYNPFYMTKISNVQFTATTNYRENRRQFKQNVPNVGEEIYYKFEGNVNRNMKVNLTLKNSEWFTGLANKIGAAQNKKFEANKRESGQGFAEIDRHIFDDKSGEFNDKNDVFTKTDFAKDDFFDNDDFDKKMKDIEHENDFVSKRKETEEKEISDDYDMKEGDTKGKPDSDKSPTTIFADFFGLLGKVQNFTLSYENQYGSRYDQRDERPDFLYQLGIPHVLANSELRQKTNNDSYSASTGFPIIRNLTSDWRYSYQIQRTFASANSQSTTTVWPDVRLTLTGFERLIRAQKVLTSSRITSAYSYTERMTGDINWKSPKTEVLTHSFNPLVGWTGNWANNLTSSFTVSMTNSENLTHQTGFSIIRENEKMTYSGSLGYSFSADQGIKIPFIEKKIYFKNQMQSELQVNFETETSTTQGRDSKQIDRDTQKLVITPRASYNFHRNVKGGLSGTYDITTDKRRDEKINIFRLDLWIEVIF